MIFGSSVKKCMYKSTDRGSLGASPLNRSALEVAIVVVL